MPPMECVNRTMLRHLACFSGQAYVSWVNAGEFLFGVKRLPLHPWPLFDQGRRALCLALLFMEYVDITMLCHLACFSGQAYVSW